MKPNRRCKMKVELEIEGVPDWWEAVRFGLPVEGEWFVGGDGSASQARWDFACTPCLIICKARWKPEDYEKYWFVLPNGKPDWDKWRCDTVDTEYHAFGNCFPTREAAEQAAERVKAALLAGGE